MEPSGYLHFDPYNGGKHFEKPSDKEGLIQFLNIIYDHCWQRHKPAEEQYGETPFTKDFFSSHQTPTIHFFV